MASVCKINGKWRAAIRRKGYKPVSRYFDTEREAKAWARRFESALDQNTVALDDRITVSSVISEYRKLREDSGRPLLPESNEHYMLEHLDEDLGPEKVASIQPPRLVKWAQQRKKDGAGPYTVNMELSKLGTALRHVASFRSLSLPDVVGQARPLLHHLQLIGGGGKRSRRPEGDELEVVLEAFRDRPDMRDAIEIASITGLRRGEICGILWSDLDPKRRAILVRDRKHPRAIESRDEWVPLLGKAWEIVSRQPREDDQDRIFTFHPSTLSKYFKEVCDANGIPNLHFHDLRRHATSVLREMGFDADERKKITGHRSDVIHERYVDVTLESLHARFDKHLDTQPRPARPQKRGPRHGK